MSGEAGFAYISDKTVGAKVNGVAPAQATTAGMAQTDGSITIAATDDLGGGMTLSVAHTVDLKGRQSVAAENTTMTLSGSFGTVLMGSLNASNGILGLGGAGGVGRGLDSNGMLDGDAGVDMIQYTSPELMKGLKVSINTAEVGLGAGDGAVQSAGVGVSYSAGPLSVSFDNTTFSGYAAAADATARNSFCVLGGTTATAAYGTACAAGSTVLAAAVKGLTAAQVLAAQKDSRQRLSFSYDLGVAKVGYGTQTKQYAGTGVDNKQTIMGISAPFGAVTVSLARSTNKDDGAATKITGTDLGINYAMSKRTALNLSSMKTQSTGAVANTFTRLRLKTTF